MKKIFTLLIMLSGYLNSHSQVITTVAGTGSYGYTGDGGSATAADLSGPSAIAFNYSGEMYIADGPSLVVRKVDLSGNITTVAGFAGGLGRTGDGGPATNARMNDPRGLVFDRLGNYYIVNRSNGTLRKVTPAGTISTKAGTASLGYGGDGGMSVFAYMSYITGIAIDTAGNLFIADAGNHRIRKASTTGTMTTVAGNGTAGYTGDGGAGASATLDSCWGVAIDTFGNLYIADRDNNVIRKMNASGIISTFAGTGTAGFSGDGGAAVSARLDHPTGVLVDPAGNVYISEMGNRIRKVNTSGVITTIAGTGTAGYSGDCGDATAANINAPWSIAMDAAGNLYIADTYNFRVRKIVMNIPPPGPITGPTYVCSGASIALSDTSVGGTWSSSDTSVATVSATGVVTGRSAGLDTIRYTVTNCYTAVATAVISVIAQPGSEIISGPSVVCPGSTITLTDTAAGGTWSSVYPAIASVSATGVVYGIGSGTDTIKYYYTNACGSGYALKTIVISPSNDTITGPTSVCETGSITLSSTAAGGTWSTSNASMASIAATGGPVTGIATGSVTITHSFGAAGCDATYYINVAPLPGAYIRALSSTSLCPGGSVALVAGTGTGSSFQWYNSSGAITGATTAFFTATTASNYQVAATSTAGCSSLSSSVTVSVSPATATITASGATTFCAGGSVTLSANTGAGLQYQWLSGGAAVTGATNSTFSAVTSGNYAVMVINTSGCSAISTTLPVTVVGYPSSVVSTSGPLSFCAGSNVTLTAISGTRLTYQWQQAGTDIAGATAASYLTSFTGTYRVNITDRGCTSTSTSLTVTVNSLPTAGISSTGPTQFCAGDSVILTAAATTGYSYQWARGASAIAGATNASYTATVTGSYNITVSSAAGCAATPAMPIVVTVTNAPVPGVITGPDTLCIGESISYRNSVAGGTWQVTTGNATVNVSGLTIGRNEGADTLFYTVTNTCGTATVTKAIAVEPCITGVTEPSSGVVEIDIYPNPTAGIFTVYAPETITSIVVSNPMGAIVFAAQPGEQQISVNLDEMPAGIYFIRVNTGHTLKVLKY